MPHSKVRHIFVYGTLMAKANDPVGDEERDMMRRSATYIGPAAISGEMYDAGSCPAAVRVDGRSCRHAKVQGELWTLPIDSSLLMVALDRYEGCGIGSAMPYRYIRTKCRIRQADGRRVIAWIYVWNLPIGTMPKIESGRWESKLDMAGSCRPRPTSKKEAVRAEALLR